MFFLCLMKKELISLWGNLKVFLLGKTISLRYSMPFKRNNRVL